MSGPEPRRALIAAARRTVALGLNHGTTGNLSVRVPGGMLVTPSAIPFDELEPGMLPAMALDGHRLDESTQPPTTEWRLHAAVLRARPDLEAVAHAHAPAATALACLEREIPPFHYMVAAAGGLSIRCAPYATINSAALGDAAVAAMDGGRRACLLAHHGIVACGPTPEVAVGLAEEVEWLAEQYLRTLSVDEPPRLPEPAMRDVLARFERYGRRAPPP